MKTFFKIFKIDVFIFSITIISVIGCSSGLNDKERKSFENQFKLYLDEYPHPCYLGGDTICDGYMMLGEGSLKLRIKNLAFNKSDRSFYLEGKINDWHDNTPIESARVVIGNTVRLPKNKLQIIPVISSTTDKYGNFQIDSKVLENRKLFIFTIGYSATIYDIYKFFK